MKILEVKNIDRLVEKVLPKTPQKNKRIVESILADVQKNGDRAVKKYEKKFGKASISSFRITKSEIKEEVSSLDEEPPKTHENSPDIILSICFLNKGVMIDFNFSDNSKALILAGLERRSIILVIPPCFKASVIVSQPN